ncbi:MAG: hypothetical protein ACYSRP_03975 [Planctomycetota bacterium]
MIHYSCDMCGQIIQTEDELRYVVKIEVYPADETDEEHDGIDEPKHDMTELSIEEEREVEEGPEDEEDDMEYRTLRFDLCSECHKRYIRDPLFVKSHRSRFFDN